VVSLTLARGQVPVPVAPRLFLHEEWTREPARLRRASVPPVAQAYRTKGAIALAELDRVRAAGVTLGTVLADGGYGVSAEFRHALTARGLTWAVGTLRIQQVFPPHVRLRTPRPRLNGGRPRRHAVPSHVSRPAEEVLVTARWRSVSCRTGTRGPLRAKFASARVHVADGTRAAKGQHLPGALAWLVGEWRTGGERKCYLTNHAAGTPLGTLAAAIKARWVCEQARQQLKKKLGLDHCEVRSWLGLHHHALFTMLAFTFLQDQRFRTTRGKKTAGAGRHHPSRRSPRSVARASSPCARGPAALPRVRRAHPVSPVAVKNVAKSRRTARGRTGTHTS